MLNEAYEEMISLSRIDLYCRDYYRRTGEYLSHPTNEEIRELIRMWGKMDRVMSDKDIGHRLRSGSSEGLLDIFSMESLFFDEGKDINIFSANRYFRMMSHSHDYFEIELVLEGQAVHNPGEHEIPLNRGDIVLVPPQMVHNTQPIDDATIVDLEIRLSTFEDTFRDILSSGLPISAYFKGALYGDGAHSCVILHDALDDCILALISMIWQENRKDSPISVRKSSHLCKALLCHIAEAAREDNIFDVYEHRDEEFFRIRSYILEHLDSVTLTELAKVFHKSESVLSRYISLRSGTGFAGMLRNLRLEKAEEMLRTTDADISAIALQVGYAGTSHFISLFKDKYGTTPLQYRREAAKKRKNTIYF